MSPDDRKNALRIPDEQDWENHPDDLDWTYARRMFFGKSLDEAASLFAETPIERVEDLRFMPRIAFQYYIRAYARFLLQPQALVSDDPPSVASCFLDLLEEKLQQDKGFVTLSLLGELLPAIEHVAARQQEFDADEDIFGNFQEKAERIREKAGL